MVDWENISGIIQIMEIIIFIGLLVGSIFALKSLQPWWKKTSGKAELRQAEWNKQISVEEAKAKKESASLLAQAEIERAKGVAESNKIIAKSINEQYLRYLYIIHLSESENKIIYIPTEGGIPILEAGRLKD